MIRLPRLSEKEPCPPFWLLPASRTAFLAWFSFCLSGCAFRVSLASSWPQLPSITSISLKPQATGYRAWPHECPQGTSNSTGSKSKFTTSRPSPDLALEGVPMQGMSPPSFPHPANCNSRVLTPCRQSSSHH